MHQDRTERIEFRLPPNLKNLYQKAAALRGLSMTDFIISQMTEAATETVLTFEHVEYTLRDRELMVRHLTDDTLAPTAEMLALAARVDTLIKP